MWMSDKMIVQEDLASSLSDMIHCLQTPQQGLYYSKTKPHIMPQPTNKQRRFRQIVHERKK